MLPFILATWIYLAAHAAIGEALADHPTAADTSGEAS